MNWNMALPPSLTITSHWGAARAKMVCSILTSSRMYIIVIVPRNWSKLKRSYKILDWSIRASTMCSDVLETLKIIFLPRKCQKLEIRLIQNGQKFQMVKITISHPKYLLFRSKAFQEYKNFQKILISRYCYLHLKF